MKRIAVTLRALQLFAHLAHHRVSGPAFFADHKFLGKLYPAYEAAYDAVVERMIGNGVPDLDLFRLTAAANDELQAVSVPRQPDDYFTGLLAGEQKLQAEIAQCLNESAPAEFSSGTQNLLCQFADESEARCYQFRQRLALGPGLSTPQPTGAT